MPPDPGSPTAWLVRAKSDLSLARGPHAGDVLLEDLCYHAQQVVERSLKAVLLSRGVPVARTHSIERLVDLLPADIQRTQLLESASELTDHATTSRYPSDAEWVSEDEYREALAVAEAVFRWARSLITEG
jgi:HEPN domain-containing protein